MANIEITALQSVNQVEELSFEELSNEDLMSVVGGVAAPAAPAEPAAGLGGGLLGGLPILGGLLGGGGGGGLLGGLPILGGLLGGFGV